MISKSKKNNPLIHIGTSGWSYAHWKENFYPSDVKTKEWLNYYGKSFHTVEVNSTFYRTPPVSTFQTWHDQVPESFLFSIKANRYITHIKRLKDCKDSVEYLYKNLTALNKKVGPILFQLPPSFGKNMDRLKEFLEGLNPEYQSVFEFRHESWFEQEVYDFLTKHKIGLCITDLNGDLSPEVITTDFTYLRLHGPKKAYQSSYGKEGIDAWYKRIKKWSKEVSVFCYFDNDEKGYAIKDAEDLSKCFM